MHVLGIIALCIVVLIILTGLWVWIDLKIQDRKEKKLANTVVAAAPAPSAPVKKVAKKVAKKKVAKKTTKK